MIVPRAVKKLQKRDRPNEIVTCITQQLCTHQWILTCKRYHFKRNRRHFANYHEKRNFLVTKSCFVVLILLDCKFSSISPKVFDSCMYVWEFSFAIVHTPRLFSVKWCKVSHIFVCECVNVQQRFSFQCTKQFQRALWKYSLNGNLGPWSPFIEEVH